MLRLHAGMHKWDVEESEECHCPIPVPLYCNLDLFCAFCCWFWVPCLKAELVKLWTLWVPLHSARKVNLTSRRFKRRWFHGQSCDAGFGMANHDELGIALYIYNYIWILVWLHLSVFSILFVKDRQFQVSSYHMLPGWMMMPSYIMLYI